MHCLPPLPGATIPLYFYSHLTQRTLLITSPFYCSRQQPHGNQLVRAMNRATFVGALTSAGNALSTAGADISSRIASARAAAEQEKELRRAAQAATHLCDFRAALLAAHVANVEAFLELQGAVELYPRPGAARVATGTAATARRLAPLALKAAEATPYVGSVAKLAKYAIKYGTLTALFLSPSFRMFTDDVVPRLVQHAQDAGLEFQATRRGAIEAELALRLWYLGCTHAMAALLDEENTAASLAAGNEAPEAPDELIASLGEWLGPAQWLSAAYRLPAPHNTPEWASWFAARLAAKAGWTVLACHGAGATESPGVPTYPVRTPIPAWLLAAQVHSKRAVLVLRGTYSENDAHLDSQLEPAAWEPAEGGRCFLAHGGILRAARAILDDCGCRATLERLRAAGYELTVVGHSLGAGVATLITALLLFGERPLASDPSLPPPPPGPPPGFEPYTGVTCIAYACPACVDLSLSSALKPALTTLTHNDDAVPRLSDTNCRQLALDLIADDDCYREVGHHQKQRSPSATQRALRL